MRSSGSNGVAERAIKEVEYQVRTMKSALDQNVNTDIGAESSILTWMIEFASVLINRSYERLKGKASKMGIGFAETVILENWPSCSHCWRRVFLLVTGHSQASI